MANFESSITIRAGVEGIGDLNQLLDIIEEAGGDVSQLRAQTEQLNNTWNTLTTEEQTRQLNELATSTQGLARDTNRATEQMERFLGVRSNNSINQEISQVNTALAVLRQRLEAGTISQDEFNRMSQAGQTRLNALQGELNQTAAGLNRIDGATAQAGVSLNNLKTTLLGMAGAYVGIDSVISGISSLVETSKQLDSLNQKLAYATGGAKEAGETFDYLKGIAKELGLEQMGLANGYAQLASATKNLNMSQADTRTAFEGVAKATAAMSLTADEANGVFLALSQIASKGKVSMEELRGQLGERLTPAFGIAAQAMGVTTAELEKMVENGINATEFLPKFGAALTESFGEQAGNNIKTRTGQINELTNAITNAKEKLLNSFAGDAISSGINLLTEGIELASEAIDSIDPTTIELVKNTVEQLGAIASTTFSEMMNAINTIEDNFSALMGAISGVSDESQRLSIIETLILGINVSLGVFNDGLKTIGIAFDLATGVSDKFFSNIANGLSKVTFGELSNKLKAYATELDKNSGEAFDRAQQKALGFKSSAVEAMQKAAEASRVHMDEIAQQAEKASQRAIDSFDRLAKNGKTSGEELVKGFNEAVSKATTPEQVDGLIAKYNELFSQGKITGEQLAQGMNAAKDKAQELEQSIGRQIPTMAELGKEGEKAAIDIKTKMADTATTLGLDFEKAGNKTSEAFTKTAQAVLDIGQNFDELKTQGYDASNLIMQGITKMQAAAKNKADFDLLNATIAKMGQEGKLSGDQTTKALDDTKKKAQELEASLTGSANAYKTLGLQSQAELQAKAQQYKAAYETIANDATASEAIKKQAFDKYAQSVIDGNNGIITSELQVQAAARGYANISVENGKVATKTAEEIAAASDKNIDSHRRQRDAIKETTEADTQATQVQQQNSSSLLAWMQAVTNGIKGKISALQEYGATAEQINTAFDSLSESYRARTYGDFRQWAAAMGDLDQVVKRSVDSFKQAATGAAVHAQMLSSTEVSANNLAEAELALYRAQQANINGIIRMDGATLDNLKRQIDSARERMQDFADAAKTTADNLEADLARIKGDDALAMQLEQTRKLQELQDKLADAQKRSNAEEVAQLQRALDLQRQINAEQTRQAEAKKQQELAQQQENARLDALPKQQASTSSQGYTSTTSQSNVTADAVVAELLNAAEVRGGQAMLQQLMDEVKRQAV